MNCKHLFFCKLIGLFNINNTDIIESIENTNITDYIEIELHF